MLFDTSLCKLASGTPVFQSLDADDHIWHSKMTRSTILARHLLTPALDTNPLVALSGARLTVLEFLR
jgi:hypothetical protein